ncbi:MAG: DUF2332 domain-containing protein [Actinobacteria bacterium]|nr:DUF2332 domain-containing protein [Actinomycetota bacterium]
MGSRLYGDLLELAATDVEDGGFAARILDGHGRDAPDSALALRFMGGVHRMVLEGRAPELARFYPSAGGKLGAGGDELWAAFATTLGRHADALRDLIDLRVQTNEVGRCAALIGGFLLVAQQTRRPLRILEIGAAAGLNLRWDRYRYEARGRTWGDSESLVRLCSFDGDIPALQTSAEVVDRRGCDLSPVDPTSEDGRITLHSYVWPDQLARIRHLRLALEVARRFPVPVDEEDAVAWLEQHSRTRREGMATIVFHSIVMQYLTPEDRTRARTLIEQAGARASPDAPFAWLRMEPSGDEAEVRLTLWPPGTDRLVARSGFHGDAVRWLA